MLITLLYTAYYLIGGFYMACGFILIFSPRVIEHLIPKFFPLLAHFKLQRISNAINLILMGAVLILVANKLVEANFFGFFLVMFFSIWEIYLAFRFYYFHRKDVPDAILHLMVNSLVVIAVVFFIIGNFSIQISDSKESFNTIISIKKINNK